MIVYEHGLCNTFFRMYSARYLLPFNHLTRVIDPNLSLLKASLRGYVIITLCHLR